MKWVNHKDVFYLQGYYFLGISKCQGERKYFVYVLNNDTRYQSHPLGCIYCYNPASMQIATFQGFPNHKE